jgi:RNA polymerase sigma factor (sigma-70 family)
VPIDINDIIKLCRAGDQKAFEMLYKNFYRMLYGIALRYSKSAQEAEDILQDAFIKIFNNMDSYSGQGSFEGWMRRIVQNTAINNYRSRQKFMLHVDISNIDERLKDESITDLFDKLENKEIIVLLNQMPEGYRMVINMYAIDGYSHKEIADALGITEGTSKSQLFKAKAYLKQLMLEKERRQVI